MNNRNIVKTSHNLNHFRGGYTRLELDFIYAFISTIKDEDEEFREYSLPLKELEKKLNKRLQLRDIEYLFDTLISKTFKINNKDKLAVYTFFTRLEFDKNSKVLSVKFNEDLKPHLLKLKTYAKGDFRYILQFKSEYTKRIYMLLAQWRKAGAVEYSVEQLREMLDVPKKYAYGDFKRWVLLKAHKELSTKESDLMFDYEELKKEGGKKVTHILFKIIKSGGKDLEIKDDNYSHLLKKVIYYNGENRTILNVWKSPNHKSYVLVQMMDEQQNTMTDEIHISNLEKMVEYMENQPKLF